MSKPGKKLIKINRNEYRDHGDEDQDKFPDFTMRLKTIDSILLLLESDEEAVLINVLRHIVQQAHRMATTVSQLKEKNLLQLLLRKQFFCNNLNVYVKRLSLHLASLIMENSNCLVDFEPSSQLHHKVVSLSLDCYKQEDDDFCCEYLSVIINKCLDDPQCCDLVLKDASFIEKYFSIIAATTDPDILLNSLELLLKLLPIQKQDKETRELVTLPTFLLNRLLCELGCEFFEIRQAVLRVVHFLWLDSHSNYVSWQQDNLATSLLKQLTNMFCESSLNEELTLLVAVLAAAMDQQNLMISKFFELNLFDKYLERLDNGSLDRQTISKALWVFAECAKSAKFLTRLVSANILEKFLECLLTAGADKVEFHVLLGLNRFMVSSAASKTIIDACEQGLLQKLLEILGIKDLPMRTHELSALLLQNLLAQAFHKTSEIIFASNFLPLIANIFARDADQRSTDLTLTLLNIIEMLSGNSDFRFEICKNVPVIKNIALLLKNSFSNAVLATHLFRCLCCLVVEEQIHDVLLEAFLCSSIKRALQSSSNQMKSAVTNFIMQTARFSKFKDIYNGKSILELLLLRQKHAFCVPTWQPAIESILCKNLTMKFCIRNCLGFVDVTAGHDFMVSKRKFHDFRLFQCILKEEVSPLQPVIVINFNRPQNPENLVVKVPTDCFHNHQHRPSTETEWCYCRSPGDEFLPQLLQEVNSLLAAQYLLTNPLRIQQNTRIDFDTFTKRAKIIAQVVAQMLGKDLQLLDLNGTEECSLLMVNSHLKKLCMELHCSFIPLGRITTGCKFERALLFKALADQVGLPCTLQRSVDGRVLFNELALPLEIDDASYCARNTLSFIPWRMLRPTHIVDLMYNVGDVYPLQSRQALQYLRLC